MTRTAQVPRVRYRAGDYARTIDRTRTLELFEYWAERADRAVETRLLHERVWILTDPTVCRLALAAPVEQVRRSSRYRRLIAVIGRSLLTTDGLDHRRRRRAIQPAFAPSLVADYAPAIVAAAEDTGRAWESGQVVDMGEEMATLTLAAIGSAVLGVDGRAQAARLRRALDHLQRAMVLMLLPGADRVLRSRIPVPGLPSLRRSVAEFRALGATAAESDAPLVRALREATDTPGQLSKEDLRDELLTLLLAGHETTAITLTWTWWFLDRHPEVAERMRSEHAEVLGERAPTAADLDELDYTTAVVAESLRLRPPAWIIEREVAADVDLDGLRPPRRTVLAVSPWLLHRDPTVWADPLAFRPDRWLTPDGRYDQNAPGHPRGAYLPFGAGSHVCVGASFAWAEAVLVLATLARRWRPTSTVGDPGIRALATVRPAAPLSMRLEPAIRTVECDVRGA